MCFKQDQACRVWTCDLINLTLSNLHPIRVELEYEVPMSYKRHNYFSRKCMCQLEQKTKQMENKTLRQTAKCHLKAPNLKDSGRGLPELFAEPRCQGNNQAAAHHPK